MAMVEDGDHKKPSAILHYCKICNRGFGCGGALGGHMRAHNIAEVIDRIHEQQQQPTMMSDFCHKPESNNKHSYFLRTTSNRFTNFQSSLLYNGEDEKVSPISSSVSEAEDGGGGAKRAYIWKSIRAKDDEIVEDFGVSREEEDLANFLVRLSNNSIDDNKANEVPKRLFQCKACKKVFNSHQALGGHRASHKKVKGCYAARLDNDIVDEDSISHDEFSLSLEFDNSHNSTLTPTLNLNYNTNNSQQSKRKSKEYECSICHRVFSSGQALGGHKRCHWLQNDSAFVPNFHDQFQCYGGEYYKNKSVFRKSSKLVDLNLPSLFNDTNENSAKIYLPPKRNNIEDSGEKQENYPKRNIENSMRFSLHGYSNEEEGRDKKLTKLNNVREMELEGGSSPPWLQVGLASTCTH